MNTSTDVTALIARWQSGVDKPFKGKLIDVAAYEANPESVSCFCAQGQALHLIGGYEPRALEKMRQADADKATAELLGISRAHAVLLRNTNDSIDGAPAIVLTNPELVIGDQAPTILAFWWHVDRMTKEQWAAAGDAAWAAARAAAWDAAWAAARAAARDAARDAAGAAAWAAAWNAAGGAARAAAWDAAGDAARAAAWDAARDATADIMGASQMRAKGQAFYFLPMFGFADPEAVLASVSA